MQFFFHFHSLFRFSALAPPLFLPLLLPLLLPLFLSLFFLLFLPLFLLLLYSPALYSCSSVISVLFCSCSVLRLCRCFCRCIENHPPPKFLVFYYLQNIYPSIIYAKKAEIYHLKMQKNALFFQKMHNVLVISDI